MARDWRSCEEQIESVSGNDLARGRGFLDSLDVRVRTRREVSKGSFL